MAKRFPQVLQPKDPLTIRSLRVASRHGKKNGNLFYPRTVAVDSRTKLIYVVEGSYSLPRFSRVSIFSDSGNFLDSFTHKVMRHPWGLAIDGNNAYITDIEEHCVFHFKLSPDISLINRKGTVGSGIGEFNQPHQLAVSASGDLYVTDLNHRVQILDEQLRYKRHISHQSMTQPCDVKLAKDQVYVLSKYDSPCMHVFSYEGEKMRSLITRGSGLQVDFALFFCLDDSLNLIISDWNSHQIKIFSNDGSLLDTIGQHGPRRGKFYRPHGVTVIDNFKLIIASENGDNSLQIFSM